MTWPIAIFSSMVVAFFIVLNINDRKRRKAMTPEQRKAEDDEVEDNRWP